MTNLAKPDTYPDKKLNEGIPLQQLKDQHFAFNACDGIKMLTDYLTKQFPINQDYLKIMSDICFQESDKEIAEKKKTKDFETCDLSRKID